MNKLIIFLLAAPLVVFLPHTRDVTQQNSLGTFAEQSDVGNPLHPGRATYDAGKQEYAIESSGTNMWAGRDEFHFVWRKLKGDFILTAGTAFVGNGVEPHRKIGWMVRFDLADDSPHGAAVLHGDGLDRLHGARQRRHAAPGYS